MGFERFSGIPERRARAAVLDVFSSRFIFISLFIIFASACLLLVGCTNEEVIGPGGGGNDDQDDPICPLDTPWVEIVSPDVGDSRYYPPRIEFSWEQIPEYKIAFTRYLIVDLLPGDTGTEMLNEHPEQFDGLWTEWKEWEPAGDSAVIGEDDPLANRTYFFAVQAMDSCGNETDTYEETQNARQFTVQTFPPVLTMFEPMLGSGTFIGTLMHPQAALVLQGVVFEFKWYAESSYSWFAPVQFRYGWDIQNLGDDGEWTYPWSSQIKWSHPMSFNSGVHVFHVEARDDAGTVTRARVEIEVIPYTREYDLLWIDDFLLSDVYDPLRIFPTETEHDEFWTGICSRAPGFDGVRDIYEADIYSSDRPLPLTVLANYRNVVWTYSPSTRSAWNHTIKFEPIPTRDFPAPNSLRMFLAAGGSALTCGVSMRPGGGLGSTFPDNHLYPSSVTDDLANYDYDEEYAKYSMAHDDYYVTVIDKVSANFKTGTDIPDGINRSLHIDAMRFAIKTGDSYYPYYDYPDTLLLSEEITQPGMFFDPQERGFYYAEVYDPQYYMDHILKESHRCFTPIYLMRARSTRSAIDYAAVALKGTLEYMYNQSSYNNCERYRQSYYESYHFGLPLWFMDHDQVEQIADNIFLDWNIR